jgi:hypothetical protein
MVEQSVRPAFEKAPAKPRAVAAAIEGNLAHQLGLSLIMRLGNLARTRGRPKVTEPERLLLDKGCSAMFLTNIPLLRAA